MLTFQAIIVFVVSTVASTMGVWRFLGWSLRREILDVPNERSSHVVPTPRGAGIVIVSVSLFSYVLICWLGGLRLSLAYLIAALLIAGVSWLDDVFSVPSIVRLAVHLVGATLVVAETQSLAQFVGSIALRTTIAVLAVVWLVGFTNAYNFMDGIDGIAGIQAAVAAVGWAMVAVAIGAGAFILFPLSVGGAVCGFLIFNLPPAKVFMGDVGSAFLGFTLASMPFLIAGNRPEDLLGLCIPTVFLVWFFVFDAFTTLLRRIVKGEKVWLPHRRHIYQQLVKSGFSRAAPSVSEPL